MLVVPSYARNVHTHWVGAIANLRKKKIDKNSVPNFEASSFIEKVLQNIMQKS